MKEYTVKVDYVDKQTGERFAKAYTLDSYVNNVSYDLKQVLFEVENIFSQIEDYKPKEYWSEESKDSFFRIRKKLLNHINGIARLPSTLCCDGIPINSVPASEMVADIINKH